MKVLSVGSKPQHIEKGLSVGVFQIEAKCSILLNLPASRQEGVSFAADLLRLSKVLRYRLAKLPPEQATGDSEGHGDENDGPEPAAASHHFAGLALVDVEGERGLGEDLGLHLRGHRILGVLVEAIAVKSPGRRQGTGLQAVLEEFLMAGRIAPMNLHCLPKLSATVV
jgi:hypothetical protein